MIPKLCLLILGVLLVGFICDIEARKQWKKPEPEPEPEPPAEVDEKDDEPEPPPHPVRHGKKPAAAAPAEDDDDDDKDAKKPAAKKDKDDDDDDDDKTQVKDDDDGDEDNGDKGDDEDEEDEAVPERDYDVGEIFHLNEDNTEVRRRKELLTNIALERLHQIVDNQIAPIEKLYKYEQLSRSTFGEAEIFAKPLVLLMEPYKRGKSSILPILLGKEETADDDDDEEELENTDFVIHSYAAKPRTLEGIQVLRNETFESLQRFGKALASHLKAVEAPHSILERISIVETPDLIENSKLDREFPMGKVHQWFVARADAVILVVEPDRLDVGPTLEAVFKELKDQEDLLFVLVESGHKSNLDDSIRALRRLVWSFAPHFDVNEAPKVYLTSFEKELDADTGAVYIKQEKHFLHDLNKILDQRFKNRLNTVFERAVDVRNHAHLVDKYVETYTQKKSFFGSNKALENDLMGFPSKFAIYESVLRKTNASADDLPDPEEYKEFFGINKLSTFKTLAASCSFLKGCPADKLNYAIHFDLPELLEKFQQRLPLCLSEAIECVLEEKKYVPEKKKKKAH
ncbi:sarcalumenin-like isoform X2 [Paramacrobiotus metropolitanus]|uniref:sarcalumenin-like isoform X2 n=1 Tax=Paramacrobiotus metropolitanus TaxID=2943436 RepID=UPI00244587D6|nr:sarcalumenin-like isoform X2 [Paramacrobiotus metropolitanus]